MLLSRDRIAVMQPTESVNSQVIDIADVRSFDDPHVPHAELLKKYNRLVETNKK